MVFTVRNISSFFELITLDALPVSSGGLLVFVIAKLVILAVPDGIRQVLLVHPMVGKVVCVLIMLAFYCGIGAIIMLILQLPRDRPLRPARTSASARSMALRPCWIWAGRHQITASANGIRASGRPSMLQHPQPLLRSG